MSGLLATQLGFCLDCKADVTLDDRGRCVGCGGLGIPPSTDRRVEFLSPAIWADYIVRPARDVVTEPVVRTTFSQARTDPRFRLGRGVRRWSLLYEACVDCKRTDQPHRGQGRCPRCWQRVRARATAALAGV